MHAGTPARLRRGNGSGPRQTTEPQPTPSHPATKYAPHVSVDRPDAWSADDPANSLDLAAARAASTASTRRRCSRRSRSRLEEALPRAGDRQAPPRRRLSLQADRGRADRRSSSATQRFELEHSARRRRAARAPRSCAASRSSARSCRSTAVDPRARRRGRPQRRGRRADARSRSRASSCEPAVRPPPRRPARRPGAGARSRRSRDAESLERLEQGHIPLAAAERLAALAAAGAGGRPAFASDLSVAEFALLHSLGIDADHARDGLLDLPRRLAERLLQRADRDRGRSPTPTTRAAGSRSGACSRRRRLAGADAVVGVRIEQGAPRLGAPARSSSSPSAPRCACRPALRGARRPGAHRPRRPGVLAAVRRRHPPGRDRRRRRACTTCPRRWQTVQAMGGGMFGTLLAQPGARRLHAGRLRRARARR